jgi:two-component system sensor histidine kinase BaeS
MNFKLLHKLFLVNLSVISVLVFGLLGASYYSSKSIFNDMINNMETEASLILANELSKYYEKNKSWNALITQKELWHKTIKSRVMKSTFIPVAKVSGQKNLLKIFMGDASQLVERISLLDSEKNTIIQASIKTEKFFFQAITYEGVNIAWLKFGVLDFESNMATAYYLERQLSIIYWLGVIAVFAAALCSFYLSRAITAPIKKVSQGARELARRNFDLKIDINTNDELQDLAENFNKIAKELSRYEVRQKQWIMDISHELRTPLTILQGEFEAINDGVSTYDKKMLLSLKEEVLHISRLVNDLHELSVTDTLEFDYQNDDVDIYLLITNYLARYQNKLSSSGLSLHYDLEAAKVIIPGDVYRLAQVFKNILDNSVHYIEKPGHLWIEAEQVDNKLYLKIHDSGPGVSDDAITKIFDRLYRFEHPIKRRTAGAGVGLAICKNIINAHGGNIFASHSPKGGLCINIELSFTKQRS